MALAYAGEIGFNEVPEANGLPEIHFVPYHEQSSLLSGGADPQELVVLGFGSGDTATGEITTMVVPLNNLSDEEVERAVFLSEFADEAGNVAELPRTSEELLQHLITHSDRKVTLRSRARRMLGRVTRSLL